MIAAKQASCQQQQRAEEASATAAAATAAAPRAGEDHAGPSNLSPQQPPPPPPPKPSKQEDGGDETRSERLPFSGWPTLLASSGQPSASAKIQLKQQRFLAAAAKSANSPRRQRSPHPQHCRQAVAAAVAQAKAGPACCQAVEASDKADAAVDPTAATAAVGALSPSAGGKQQQPNQQEQQQQQPNQQEQVQQQRARPEAALTTSAPILIEGINQKAEAKAATTYSQQQQLEAEGRKVRQEEGEEAEEEDNKNKTTRESEKVSERDKDSHDQFYSDAEHNDKASAVTELNSNIGSLAGLLQTSHYHQHYHHNHHHHHYQQQHKSNHLLSSSSNNDINDYHRHHQPQQQQQQNILHHLNQTTTSHPNHHFHNSHSTNNNIIKTPTIRQQLHHRQQEANSINHHKELITTPIVNNNADDNFTSSSTINNHVVGSKSIGQNNNNNTFITTPAANNQPQQQRQQFHNSNINNSHHYSQQLQYSNMAHYKFHNDCQSSVLTYEQVKRLDFVMDQTVPIHGRGNFPTLYVKLKELIRLVKYKLQKEHSIEIRDVRLNGGAASYVLAPENSHYNDLDLIFGTDLSNEDQFDVIRDVVLECLKEFFPKPHRQRRHANEFISKSEINDSSATKEASIKANGDHESSSELFNNQESQSCLMSLCDSDNLKVTIKRSDDDDGSKHKKEDANQEQGGKAFENREKAVTVELSESRTESAHNESQTLQDSGNKVAEPRLRCGEHPTVRAIQNPQYQQAQYYQMPLSNCAMKEAYVHKMVKVNDDDRWSLISLGVQQSETNCCNQVGCLPSTVQRVNQHLSGHSPLHQHQLLVSEFEPQELINNNESNAPTVSNEKSNAQSNVIEITQHYQATNYLSTQHQYQRNHYQQHQQKQFPNSIELKFVDRMRRKFEFSVDSFQIILDSLIQFYDYAPQSTITSQRKLINSHPSSTMINTRPLINKRRCSGCCGNQTDTDSVILSKTKMHRGGGGNFSHQPHSYQPMSGFPGTGSSAPILNSSRSYYQLPIEPANSSSISSVASSSGCSSSSSVVSSLSCDEDHEDLYCDADSPSSSSASTSSLLSSTTSSLLSSDSSSCGASDSHRKSSQPEILEANSSINQQNQHRNQSIIEDSKSSLKNACKIERSPTAVANSHLSRTAFAGCIECFGQHRNLSNSSIYHFETDNRTSCAVISENFYPTVIGRSEYGNFKEALYHLEKKLIATRSPEEIRGGGLLKYCNLLVKNYKPTNVYQIRTLERYMCSRFFIDFSDLNQQQAKLESYLANHFSDDPILKFDYLTILHNVVQRSTVCLMNHELRLTLNMIRDLAYKLNEQQQQQQQQRQQQNPQLQNQNQQHVDQQSSQTQAQQDHYYQQQKPVLIQSGVYRVKLVNYTLAKSVRP